MKRHLPSLILGLALLLAGGAKAQAPFFKQNKADALVMKANSGEQSGSIADHFFLVISKAANKNLEQVRFVVAYESQLQLTARINDQIKAYAALKDIAVTGDTDYRGFDMHSYIQPTTLSMDLAIQIGNLGAANGYRKVFAYNNIGINGNPVRVAEFLHQDTTGRVRENKLLLENLRFGYKNSDKIRFDERTQLIDDYYGAAGELEVVYNQLLAVRPDDLDQLQAQEQMLLGVQQQIVAIQDMNYEGRLGLNSQLDPARFVPRLRDCQNLSRELRTQIAESIRNLPLLYYDRGMLRLNRGQRPEAIHDLNRSIELDPGFAPSHFQLAVIASQDGQVADARGRLIMIVTELQPDLTTRGAAMNMLKDMMSGDLQVARQQFQQGKFANALEILVPIEPICADIPDLNCQGDITDLIFKSHRGIYTSFLDGARADLSAGKYPEAEKKAQGALDYQQQYAAVLNDGGEAMQLLNLIRRRNYEALVQEASQLLTQQQFAQAEIGVREAISLGDKYPDAIASTNDARTLLNRIKAEEYKVLIANGERDLNIGEYRKALNAFEKARSFEKPYSLVADTRLWGLIQASARGVIDADIMAATQAAQTNQLPRARQMAQEAMDMMGTYNLNGDPNLQSKVDNLKGSIFNQECLNAQGQFDSKAAEAQGHERSGDFISAEAAYMAAIEIANRNNACGIDLNEVNAKLKEIGPPASYQKKMKAARTRVNKAMWREAVSIHAEAGRDHASNQLSKFGLHHAELIDFMNEMGRNGFYLYGADHFMEAGDLETSLDLVRKLTRRGLPKYQMKPVQTRLGSALAIRDLEQGNGGDWKSNALRHTQGDKALKTIYKAYKKQWKRMS